MSGTYDLLANHGDVFRSCSSPTSNLAEEHGKGHQKPVYRGKHPLKVSDLRFIEQAPGTLDIVHLQYEDPSRPGPHRSYIDLRKGHPQGQPPGTLPSQVAPMPPVSTHPFTLPPGQERPIYRSPSGTFSLSPITSRLPSMTQPAYSASPTRQHTIQSKSGFFYHPAPAFHTLPDDLRAVPELDFACKYARIRLSFMASYRLFLAPPSPLKRNLDTSPVDDERPASPLSSRSSYSVSPTASDAPSIDIPILVPDLGHDRPAGQECLTTRQSSTSSSPPRPLSDESIITPDNSSAEWECPVRDSFSSTSSRIAAESLPVSDTTFHTKEYVAPAVLPQQVLLGSVRPRLRGARGRPKSPVDSEPLEASTLPATPLISSSPLSVVQQPMNTSMYSPTSPPVESVRSERGSHTPVHGDDPDLVGIRGWISRSVLACPTPEDAPYNLRPVRFDMLNPLCVEVGIHHHVTFAKNNGRPLDGRSDETWHRLLNPGIPRGIAPGVRYVVPDLPVACPCFEPFARCNGDRRAGS